MEIVKDIHCIKLLFNRAFLLAGKRLILIDTGHPYQAKRIIRFIRAMGRKPEELSLIILTHHHIDHRGSARVLKRITGAKIAAHTDDIPFIEGEKHSYIGYRLWWIRFLLFLTELIFQKEQVTVDIELHDNNKIEGLVVYHTPGHTGGSISLLLKSKKVLFCGDTVPYTLAKLKRPNPSTINHKEEFMSIKKLSELDFDILLPNDCRMVLSDGVSVLKRFCHKELGIEN